MRVAILTTDNREHGKDYEAPAPYFGTAVESLLQGFEALPEIEVHVVSCLRQTVRSPEKLAKNIWYHSLIVPQNGWMRTFYQGCIRAVRRKLDEIRPDIVHGQGTEKDNAMTAVFSGRPNVLTIHGNMRQVAKALGAKPFSFVWLAARLEVFTVRRTAGVVCLTRYTEQQVTDLARKTWLVPNAASKAFFEVQRTAPGDMPTLLCVANFAPYKNQNQLIRELDPVAKEKKFRLVFAGGLSETAPYAREFLDLIKTRPWCQFVGFKKGEALRTLLGNASFLVHPSLEDNCPMVILEAMAVGLPAVASKIGGIPDLIDEGVNGLLFDPAKPGEMREAVLKLLNEPALVENMGVAGKKRALKMYHPTVVARQHMELYRAVLQRS